jgi:hypothetical protein
MHASKARLKSPLGVCQLGHAPHRIPFQCCERIKAPRTKPPMIPVMGDQSVCLSSRSVCHQGATHQAANVPRIGDLSACLSSRHRPPSRQCSPYWATSLSVCRQGLSVIKAPLTKPQMFPVLGDQSVCLSSRRHSPSRQCSPYWATSPTTESGARERGGRRRRRQPPKTTVPRLPSTRRRARRSGWTRFRR